jgi:hypothetical protein
MTQEQAVPDEISQTQVDMDKEQGLEETTPAYVTEESMRILLTEQAKAYQTQVSGLQGKLDKGLDAIRRDTVNASREEIERINKEAAERQGIISAIPEEDRERLGPVIDKLIDRTKAPVVTQAEQTAPVSGVTDQMTEQWEQVREAVRTFRLDPDDPNVTQKYRILLDQAVPEMDRWPKFVDELVALRATRTTNGATTQARPQDRTTSPPVNAAPGGGAAAFRSQDDVRTAFIQGLLGRQTDPEVQEKFQAELDKFSS